MENVGQQGGTPGEDARVVRAAWKKKLPRERVEIAADYRRLLERLGSPSERASVLDQLGFLARMLEKRKSTRSQAAAIRALMEDVAG